MKTVKTELGKIWKKINNNECEAYLETAIGLYRITGVNPQTWECYCRYCYQIDPWSTRTFHCHPKTTVIVKAN